MLAVDLTHSAHTRAQTGIQQVSRGLYDALREMTTTEAIVYDRYARAWRTLDGRERAHLATVDQLLGVRRKRPHWSTWQRLRGKWQARLRGGQLALPASGRFTGLLVPEFFSPEVGATIPALKTRLTGPAVAIFHDAIAFRQPELGMPETTARFPQYLRDLTHFDAVAAVSQASADELQECWARLGLQDTPPVKAIPIGIRRAPAARPLVPPGPRPDEPEFLMVATLETRKNHIALLDAAETLWREGQRFRLRLVGMPHAVTGRPVVARIEALQAAGHPLIWEGGLDAAALAQRYRGCWATVFPSLQEGFGLPVLESLDYGKPAISTARGGLAEVVREGGCLVVEPDAASVKAAICRLLSEPALYPRLCHESATRRIRTLQDCAADLLTWVDTLQKAR